MHELEQDEDYDISRDPEKLYGKVDFTLEETIQGKLKGCGEFKAEMQEWSVSEVNRRLSLVTPDNYGEKHRTLFFLLNLRLSELGLAPNWRQIQRIPGVKARKCRELSNVEIRFSQDCQMIDMEWVHCNYRGHRTDGQWQGLYKELFQSDTFNFVQANIIACTEFTRNEKVKGLKLITDMQRELFVLRADKVRKAMVKLNDKSDEVEGDLIAASYRNRRRGKKLRANIDSRVSVWASAEIVDNASLTTMCEMYNKMTGDAIRPSTFRNKLDSTNQALKEVNSKYAF